jgi:hypothetical protein
MCNALEYKHPEEQDRPGAFVLDGSMLIRPKNCPIIAEPKPTKGGDANDND